MPDAARVAVVIGGGNGIGEATCRLMRERGWQVVVVDKDKRAAERVASDAGGYALALDIASPVDELVERAVIELGLGL